MGRYGLAAGLHDAVALAAVFGPDVVLGFGAAEAGRSDILSPAGNVLMRDEVAAAARLGKSRYFLSFGNFGLGENESAVETVAGAIEHLAAATGVGFMAVCLAAPGLGRTVYQGHLFESGKLKADLSRVFTLALDGSVGVVTRDFVASGSAAIRDQCGRLKEQGKMLALIDAIDDDDCLAVAKATAAMPLAGGCASFAGPGNGFSASMASGRVAILSGAGDRQTIFQLGAARASLPVFDLDFASSDPVGGALAWAAQLTTEGAMIITSSVPPERRTAGAPATAILADIAYGLAAAGVRRFVVTGDETACAVRNALAISRLHTTSASGPLLWLKNEFISISVKPPGIGGTSLFVSDFEPHLRLNDIAEMAP